MRLFCQTTKITQLLTNTNKSLKKNQNNSTLTKQLKKKQPYISDA